jgi:shikimate dehydrogenase
MITGTTEIIAHLGYPTAGFKSPAIYNPYFEHKGIDAVVVPMGVLPEDYPAFVRALFRLSNIRGALVTMPHKIATVALLDESSTAVKVAGSCNAILRRPDGTLLGDMFDGAGFVRGLRRKHFLFAGASCLVVGAGGVGSAIAAALAAEGVAALALFDSNAAQAEGLAQRLRIHYPGVAVRTCSADPDGFNLVVNATPLGMNEGDPPPLDPSRLTPDIFVGEVVMKQEFTPLLRAARALGCRYQAGTDMLFEQIPAYLEFFGYGTTTPEELRRHARLG